MSIVGSIAGGIFQGKGADKAADSIEKYQNRSIDVANRTYRDSMERLDPFSQMELQQANAFAELYGFAQPAVMGQDGRYRGYNQAQDYFDQNQDVARAFNTLRPKDEAYMSRLGFDEDGDGDISSSEFANYHFQTYGQNEGRVMPTRPEPTQPTGADGQPTGQSNAFSRFEASPFAEVARVGSSRDIDRIDSALGSQGALFSSSRQAYADDAYADRMGSAFTQYMGGLMSSTPQTATNNQNVLGAQRANQVMGANSTIGSANANRAIDMGSAFTGGIQNIQDTASSALGMFGGFGGMPMGQPRAAAGGALGGAPMTGVTPSTARFNPSAYGL